jgi:hypothetical protein
MAIPVPDPQSRVAELIAHRKSREAQIRAALSEHGTATAEALARAIYTDVAPGPDARRDAQRSGASH